MRTAALIPLAVLAGGIFVALATQRLIEANTGSDSLPRLDMSQMKVHNFRSQQQTSFLAAEAVFEGSSMEARGISGRMQIGDALTDFYAQRLQMQGSLMVLEDDVVLSGERGTLKSQRVEVGDDGALRGWPAELSESQQQASFSAREFVIDEDGSLRLSGKVRGVFEP